MTPTILVVDDNREILEIIGYHIRKEGYQVLEATDGFQALDLLQSHHVSAAVLDVMMDDLDGFSLCRTIREHYYFPILFLTTRTSLDDKLEGLGCGADDYMVKPFSSRELLARIDSLIRRYQNYNQNQQATVLRLGNLIYRRQQGTIMLNDKALELTGIEYKLLKTLMDHPGETLSTEELYRHIWGDAFMTSSHNNVATHIKNLRRKLRFLDETTEYIHTDWGKGYGIITS